jgi:hypothetical protein
VKAATQCFVAIASGLLMQPVGAANFKEVQLWFSNGWMQPVGFAAHATTNMSVTVGGMLQPVIVQRWSASILEKITFSMRVSGSLTRRGRSRALYGYA